MFDCEGILLGGRGPTLAQFIGYQLQLAHGMITQGQKMCSIAQSPLLYWLLGTSVRNIDHLVFHHPYFLCHVVLNHERSSRIFLLYE